MLNTFISASPYAESLFKCSRVLLTNTISAPFLLSLGMLASAGCSNAPTRIPVAEWAPEEMADQAIKDLDKDGDGVLSPEELKAAPALEYAMQSIDTNEDGNLSRDEIRDRIALYRDLKAGLVGFSCQVMLDNKPLANAKIRLVPEPFIGDVVQPQESTSDNSGAVNFIDPEINMSVLPVCLFRVEITSTDVQIPAKYNSQTTLGIEISGITDSFNQGPAIFNLESK